VFGHPELKTELKTNQFCRFHIEVAARKKKLLPAKRKKNV